MANDLEGEFFIELGGKRRVFKLGMRSVRALENELVGISIMSLMRGGEKTLGSANTLIKVLFYGLRDGCPGLTEDQIEEWFDASPLGLEAISISVIKALGLFVGGEKARKKLMEIAGDEPAPPQEAPTDGIGKNS